ncbi:Uma2 family endonuclease [Romeria aff. gracilis LEGE 07310]|uniref:Uma2 family endonuclease n=1 Tax=Vasconcelosia minhoensis LEGE 07310 TaxID=915328 RepID=A0A8J7AR20_9CYAN|nr:Uma2 family endonuclease [Romeria gracilis]MBE9079395.1 Uma2 family endonuclease [Romeria aff. gracilis LEGE 07310]
MRSPILSQSQDAEQRVLLHGVDWQQYEGLLRVLGDNFPTLRMSYLEGTLEIMTNSPEHEDLKKMVGMLVEAYLQETRTRFHAGGSTTFRKAAKQRGLEPDECYCLGTKKDFPDLAIEIVITSGLVDKLNIYRGLGVAEVWQWQAGAFSIYCLRSSGYERVETSELLPTLDLTMLVSYVKPEAQFDAVMAFRDAIRQ